MGTRPHDTSGSDESKREAGSRPSAGTDDSKQQQREARQASQPSEPMNEDPDRVEIGDPVPEDNRTIRARGRDETGEDEDLPGGSRGETGEDEDLPDDGAGIESPSRH